MYKLAIGDYVVKSEIGQSLFFKWVKHVDSKLIGKSDVSIDFFDKNIKAFCIDNSSQCVTPCSLNDAYIKRKLTNKDLESI